MVSLLNKITGCSLSVAYNDFKNYGNFIKLTNHLLPLRTGLMAEVWKKTHHNLSRETTTITTGNATPPRNKTTTQAQHQHHPPHPLSQLAYLTEAFQLPNSM